MSLLHDDVADARRILGARQLTDLYLLGLTVRHSGRLVTFDIGIATQAIRGARATHLLAL